MTKQAFLSLALWAGLSINQAYGQSAPPKPILPLPETKQVKWQQMETYAFVHFGLNTFNDREWGFGDTPASTFNPTSLDCEQWARTFVNAGMKGVILTAKHHDGFCLWPTQLTEYSIRNTPYKNGKGDVVRELAEACKKYGLKFAVYLSPWDRNAANYGTPDYVDYFYKQLNELLTQYGPVFEIWFDGANGGDGWYGGAKEVRQIDHKTYYQFHRAYAMIDSLQPQAVIFSDSGPGCRWVGNERGFAGETNWSLLRKGEIFAGSGKRMVLQHGRIDGNQFTPAECDVSIRKGWFYHPEEDNTVKSPEQLLDLYYKSVGRNSTLLLNFPVDRRGLIPSKDSLYAVTFHQYTKQDFADNLAKKASITASNTRHQTYNTARLTDSNYDTYWATADGTTKADIVCEWKQPTLFNRVSLQEYIPLGQRVKAFELAYKQNGKWVNIPMTEETTTIGYKRLLRFAAVKTKALRIRILDAKGPICLNEIGVYQAKERPFVNKIDSIPTHPYQITGLSQAALKQLTDYNSNTIASIDGRSIRIDLQKTTEVGKLYYLPVQSSVKGMVYNYELWAGNTPTDLQKITAGEFSNIENNPVMQQIKFEPVKARYLVLKAIKTVNNEDKVINLSELYIQ